MIAANTTFQRHAPVSHIVKVALENMERKLAERNARHEAEHEVWLQNASPAEKLKVKREALILEKRRTDAEYQSASHRMDALHRERKRHNTQKWRLKHGMENRYRPDGLDSIDEAFWKARARLDDANARIEREVDEELNAGEALC